MKQIFGVVSGLAFGVIGTAIGIYCAWLGFSSTPYDEQQLGTFCGLMGAFAGCTWACIGALLGYLQKRYTFIASPNA